MKDKNLFFVELIKVSHEIYKDLDILDSFVKNFISKPIRLKDKRRNPKLYEVSDWQIAQVGDDFFRNLYTIRRTIKYKKK